MPACLLTHGASGALSQPRQWPAFMPQGMLKSEKQQSVNTGHSTHSSRRVIESWGTFTETESVKKGCTIASAYTPASC